MLVQVVSAIYNVESVLKYCTIIEITPKLCLATLIHNGNGQNTNISDYEKDHISNS